MKKLRPFWIAIINVLVVAGIATWWINMVIAGTGDPCIAYQETISPLFIGQRAQFKVGRMDISNCVPARLDTRGWQWSVVPKEVAQVTDSGTLTALSSGEFILIAKGKDRELKTSGFVLPAGYRIQIKPEELEVHLGEVVKFTVEMLDSNSQPLPDVPFTLFTPEFEKPSEKLVPLVNGYARQHIYRSGEFIAERIGSTTICAEVGMEEIRGKKACAKLTIKTREELPK